MDINDKLVEVVRLHLSVGEDNRRSSVSYQGELGAGKRGDAMQKRDVERLRIIPLTTQREVELQARMTRDSQREAVGESASDRTGEIRGNGAGGLKTEERMLLMVAAARGKPHLAGLP